MSKKCIIFLALCFMQSAAKVSTSLLIKIPTRSRPENLFKTLDSYYEHLSHAVPVHFLISCDSDDLTMNNPEVIARLASYPDLTYSFHSNTCKIEAFNRDLELYDFEMVLGAADDTMPCVQGFDQIIVDTMHQQFPDFDGVLNMHDGHVGEECNTLPVIGKAFFDRFGYFYNPEYKALVCDMEITNVSKILRKEHVIDQTLIKHNHPIWGQGQPDALYDLNERFHSADIETYKQRRAKLYDLPLEEVEATESKLWSILIATDQNNTELTEKLVDKLLCQITRLELQGKIELLVFATDTPGIAMCSIKNRALALSSGKYVQFIDPGNDISDSFVELIYHKLLKNPDCVSLMGIYTSATEGPKKVIHSYAHTSYYEKDTIYYRPPTPLNPIKRCLAIQFPFGNYECPDFEWAKKLADSKLIQSEETVETPYYFFQWQKNLTK